MGHSGTRMVNALLRAGALYALCGGLAVAAEQAVLGELEEVTVTAEKRETNLQKTASSIQVVAGDELRKQGKKRIDEIMSGVVGVGARDSQVGNLFFIRGVDGGGGGGTAATAFATTVAVMVDGAYQARGETVRGGTLDLAQAEVMRGTQSTNLGANALAGAVSLVTNKPVLGEYHANASLELGNYSLFSAEGVANIPLADRQALRIAYSQNNRDGYISNDAGNSRLMNARIKYRYQPTDTLDFVLTAGRQIIGGNGVQQGALTYSGVWEPYSPARPNCSTTVTTNCYITKLNFPYTYGLVPTPGRTYKDRSDPWNDGLPKNPWGNFPDRDTKINTLALEVNWDTPIGKLTAVPTIERARLIALEPPRGTGTTFNAQDNPTQTNQMDIRLASREDVRLTWLVGGWYFKTRQYGPFMTSNYSPEGGYGSCGPTNNNPPLINVGSVNAAGTVTGTNICRVFTFTDGGVETKSLYGNVAFKMTDAFRLKAGVRSSNDNKFQLYSLSRAQGGYDYIGGSDMSTGPTFLRIATPTGQTTCPTYACVGGFNYSAFTGYKTATYDHTWSKVSWSTGVEFDVLPNAMAYANYQTGYQPGIVNVMGASGTVNVNAAPAPIFGPENTSKQITVGFKSRWLENKLQFNVEAFQIDMKDRPFGGNNSNLLVVGNAADPQCQTFAPPTLTSSVALSRPAVPANYSCLAPLVQLVSDNRSRGVDFEVNYLPTASDRIDVSIEYLDAIYSGRPNLAGFSPTVQTVIDSATANTPAGTTPLATSNPALATTLATNLLNLYNAGIDSYVGKQVQNASKYSGNFTYEHRFSFGGGASVAPRVNAEYKSEYWSQGGTFPPTGFGLVDLLDKASLVRQEGYVLWNASIDYSNADGKFSINAYVKNIQNKPILINIGGEPGVTVNYVSLSPPRTFGVVFGLRL
jgi:iron complex outermembrane receptor protein